MGCLPVLTVKGKADGEPPKRFADPMLWSFSSSPTVPVEAGSKWPAVSVRFTAMLTPLARLDRGRGIHDVGLNLLPRKSNREDDPGRGSQRAISSNCSRTES